MALQMIGTCLTKHVCAIATKYPFAAVTALYHDMPVDKVKRAREYAAKQQEIINARRKYQPFQEITPMDDVVEMIRGQGRSHTSAQTQTTDSGSEETGVVSPMRSDNVIKCEASPYSKPPQKCIICTHNIPLDFKNVRLLSQFISPFTGRIYGARVTGLCVPMQSRIAKLIKRAKAMGYIPKTRKDERFLKDPELFNPFSNRY